MEHEERRGRLEGFLDDLRNQREVDTREALMELIHVVFELDEQVKDLRSLVSRLEDPPTPRA